MRKKYTIKKEKNMKEKSMIEILKEISVEKWQLQNLKQKMLQLKTLNNNPIIKKFLALSANPEYIMSKGIEKTSKKILKEECHHSAYIQHAYYRFKNVNGTKKLIRTSSIAKSDIIEFICLDCGTSVLISKDKLPYFKYWHNVIYTGNENISLRKILEIRLEYFRNLCVLKEENALSLVRAI